MSEIQAALTAEEWAELTEAWYYKNKGEMQLGYAIQEFQHGADSRHALAAFALYGQPFGFTHADVALLRGELHGGFKEDSVDLWAAIDDLTRRIEALLPPKAE